MDNNQPNVFKRTNPLFATAAIAVIIACGVAIAAITGILPTSSSQTKQKELLEQNAQPRHKAVAHTGSSTTPASTKTQIASVCANCGTVETVNAVIEKGKGSGLGMVAGGVAGAVLGNQVEKNNKSSRSYDIRVRMEDNTFSTVRYNVEPNVRIGDKVRVEEGRLVRD